MYQWDNNGLINVFFWENVIMGCNDDMTFKVFGDHLLCGMEHGHSNMLHLGYIKTYSNSSGITWVNGG